MKLAFGEFVLDDGARQLVKGGAEIHLTRKAFDLLTALLRERPRALSKHELHQILWPDTFVSDANLAMLVAEVRNALDDNARASRFVRTVQRYGYAFHGDAHPLAVRPGDSAAAVTHWLVAPQRQIPLLAGENLVGRDPASQVWLDSSGVSRRHARIVVEAEGAVLEDLDSKNGTRLNGTRLSVPVTVSDGDEICFGSIVVTFRIWTSDDATRTEAER